MRPLVKICGIRRLEDARLACELGAAAIGFIFWSGSPRFIDPYRARTLAGELPPFVSTVGVFVDQPPEYVAGVSALVRLGAVQLHGQERTSDYVRPGVRLIKAVAVTQGFDPETAMQAVPAHVTVLLDAHDPIKRGGTGRTVDWRLAAQAAKTRPVILSGGLNADNVTGAITAVSPYAIDVSSGVEAAPGVKDHSKLRALFAAVHRL